MTKLYRSREGEATAVDTKTQLTTLGSQTAPGPLLVPSKATKLLGAIVAANSNFAATGRADGIVRLEGAGLKNGPETISVVSAGNNVATGGQNCETAQYYELNVDVIPSQEILIFGEMTGADVGQISFGVTLVFQA